MASYIFTLNTLGYNLTLLFLLMPEYSVEPNGWNCSAGGRCLGHRRKHGFTSVNKVSMFRCAEGAVPKYITAFSFTLGLCNYYYSLQINVFQLEQFGIHCWSPKA